MPRLTPYVTPEMLVNAPTGTSWSIIPFPKSTSQQQLNEQTNICWRATGIVDGYCNQILRATLDTEPVNGPGNFRTTYKSSTGETRVILSRWPVTAIEAVQWLPTSTYPRTTAANWTTIPTGWYDIERPVMGVYGSNSPTGAGDGGQAITIAPGYGGWSAGREGFRYLISYINGWPHTSLTADVTEGATEIPVDDVTGWVGGSGTIYDNTFQEVINVTAVTATNPSELPNGIGTVPCGPGTLILNEPLSFDHAKGLVVSTLPGSILWATLLHATAQALEAGITSVSIQNIPGSMDTGGKGVHDLLMEADLLLAPFKRTI